ncbi:hypothetical protein [Streptomyces sp. NPDC097640]|uniref:hypothetical protein n=1 Tax=Streptomyces sp. NPDC097640 TaxID=3157229 RepID=UPI00331BBB4A
MQVGYQSIYAARLLHAFLNLDAWRDAVELAETIIPTIAEIASARTLTLLGLAAQQGEQITSAPSGLRDALHHMCMAISDDPYKL